MAPPLQPSHQQAFRRLPLYLGSLDRLLEEHVIDVMKLAVRPKKNKPKNWQQKSLSDDAQAAREALAADPYNMFWINELAYKYVLHGDMAQASNVLLRGWKRTGEIPDERVRFRYLMKLAELSYFQGRFRQAAAVLGDITEPEETADRRSYFILACHVHSANKESQRTLRAFQHAVEGTDFQLASRILALTVLDLKDVGLYPVARSAVERLATELEKESTLAMLDSYAAAEPTPRKWYEDEESYRYFLGAGIAVAVAVLLYLLYLAEQHSLGKLKK